MPEWVIQLICNVFFSGIVAGLVVAGVKARMEHYYQKKHEDEKRAADQKDKEKRLEKEALDREISAIRNEMQSIKRNVTLVAEKVSFVKENIGVVIAKQDAAEDRVTEVNDMVKQLVSQNFGKVRVMR